MDAFCFQILDDVQMVACECSIGAKCSAVDPVRPQVANHIQMAVPGC